MYVRKWRSADCCLANLSEPASNDGFAASSLVGTHSAAVRRIGTLSDGLARTNLCFRSK